VGGALDVLVLILASSIAVTLDVMLRVLLVLAMAALAFASDIGWRGFALPQRHRQIPQLAFDKGHLQAAGVFGFQLGLGWLTLMPMAAPWVLATSILLGMVSFWHAALIAIGWALGRSTLAWSGVARPVGRGYVPELSVVRLASCLSTLTAVLLVVT
jgi:hypothetical protein